MLISIPALAVTMTATPDRTVISENETLQLSVRIDEQVGFGGPDFSLLEGNFEILNQHRSNQFRSINGRTEQWTEWTMVLAPKQTGKLLIPSFKFQGTFSDPVEITVNDASNVQPGQVPEVYVEMEVDKESVFVQEQLLVTYKIFSAVEFREISMSVPFTVADAQVEAVSESNYRRTINGQVYRAYSVTYAIHPQKSEPLEIPSITWNLVSAGARGTWFSDPFRSQRGQVRRLRSDSRTIAVKPVPDNYSGLNWIPATEVEMEQHWSSGPNRFVVGEPITRTITLRAKGLASSQLPEIPQIASDVVKVYSDQPQFDQNKSREGLTGIRIETSAIVPTRAGSFQLPPVRVTWWDTVNQREQIAELPAQGITVAGAAVGELANLSPSPASNGLNALTPNEQELQAPLERGQWRFYWPLLVSNTVFALLCVAMFFAWMSARQKVKPAHDFSADHTQNTLNQWTKQVRQACEQNQAVQCKQALAQWGKVYFNLNHFCSLQELSRLSACPTLTAELERLDKTLYGKGNSTPWQGKDLWLALRAFYKRETGKQATISSRANHQGLRPLYPN